MDRHLLERLVLAAGRAPSADNAQPWKLVWTGSDLAVLHAHRLESPFKADSHAVLMAVGALLAHVDATLLANGVDAKWRFSPRLESGDPYAALALRELPSDLAIPAAVWQRHTNRHAYLPAAVPPEVLREVLSTESGETRLVTLVDAQERATMARLVRLSSEARFCNRALHEWLMRSLRHTPAHSARGDGLDVRTLALPPGGRQLLQFISDWRRLAWLNRIGAYRLLARVEAAPLGRAPVLLCIAGEKHASGTVAAGRCMARVWMALNQRGLAVQPYYVVTDQTVRMREGTIPHEFDQQMARVSNEAADLLRLGREEMLHMTLRVGYPQHTAMRSERLPLRDIFVDQAGDGDTAGPAMRSS